MMKKRLIACLLSVSMVFSCVPISGLAQEEEFIEEYTMDDASDFSDEEEFFIGESSDEEFQEEETEIEFAEETEFAENVMEEEFFLEEEEDIQIEVMTENEDVMDLEETETDTESESEEETEETEELGQAESQHRFFTYINPLYKDVISEEDLMNVPMAMAEGEEDLDPSAYAKTVSEAAAVWKKEVLQRNQYSTTKIAIPYTAGANIDTLLEQYYSKMLDELYKHNGVSNEGDYIRFSILGSGYSVDFTQIGNTLYATYSFHNVYTSTIAEETALANKLRTVMSKLQLSGKTEYQKISSIYTYICNHVTYDYYHLSHPETWYPEQWSAYGALVGGTAVCQGYSVLLYRMLAEAGIDSRILSGIAVETNEEHSWNMVRFGGIYYYLDVTWDSEKLAETKKTSYFLKGSRNFGITHSTGTDSFNRSILNSYKISLEDYWSVEMSDLVTDQNGKYVSTIRGAVPQISMLTFDHKLITTGSENNRAKIIIVAWLDCPYIVSQLEALKNVSLPGVDILVVFADDTKSEEQIKSYVTRNHLQILPNAYYATYKLSPLLDKLDSAAGIKSSHIYSPSMYLVNTKNQIVYSSHGLVDDIANYVKALGLTNASAPAASYKKVGSNSDVIGVCGDQSIWRFASNGTLYIEGNGKLWDNDVWPSSIGWEAKASDCSSLARINPTKVKKVVIGEGIEEIGLSMFEKFTNLQSIEIASSVTYIRNQFLPSKCKSLKVYFKGKKPVFEQNPFTQLKCTIYYPSGDKSWKKSAFNELAPNAKWTSSKSSHKRTLKKTVKATCGTNGYYLYKCSCGKEYKITIPATNKHKWKTLKTQKAPTNSTSGMGVQICETCKKTRDVCLPDLKGLVKGKCGSNATWIFHKNTGLLEISGTGALWNNYTFPTPIGWLEDSNTTEYTTSDTFIYKSDVKKIVVNKGITAIGGQMFSGFPNLNIIEIAASVKRCGASGYPILDYSTNLKKIWFKGNPPSLNGLYVDTDVVLMYPDSNKKWTNKVKTSIQYDHSKWLSVNASGKHTKHIYDSNICEMCGSVKKVKAPVISSAKRTGNGIKVSWKKVSGAEGYDVYRSTKQKSGFKKIGTTDLAGQTSFLDKNAQAGKTYYYKVKSYLTANGKKYYSGYSKVTKAK